MSNGGTMIGARRSGQSLVMRPPQQKRLVARPVFRVMAFVIVSAGIAGTVWFGWTAWRSGERADTGWAASCFVVGVSFAQLGWHRYRTRTVA